MIDCGTGDIVALQLEGTDQWRDARVVPRDVAVPGISDALDLGPESMADRVALLSALDDLKRRGIIEERKKEVRGMNGKRNAYFLTEEGREHVAKLREQLTGETVLVRNGFEEEVPLEEVDEYLPEPAIPRALSRATESGVLYLQEDVGESFVNREAERAILETTMESVLDGDAHVVLVAGEAGIGKTTLVTDEFGSAAREEGFEVLVGKCQRDTDEPYAAVRSALSRIDVDEASFEREGEPPEDAEGYAAERTAMFEGIVDSLERAADSQPLLVVIDDLHLAGDPTIELFRYLSERIGGRVMLVGTCRPEDYDPGHQLAELLAEWKGHEGRLQIDLDRFDRDETRRLIQWVLEERTIPGSFVDLIYDRTAGNPLFVKESVARMREDGTVDPVHGIFPDDPGEVPLPDRIEAAVDLRLSVLDRPTREVLEVGAIVGETVPRSVLSAAVDLPEPKLRERVDLLVDGHVWEDDGEEYLFVSGLVRETVADGIDEERRRRLHRRIADAVLECDRSGRDHHATIAHHYHEAGRYEDAVDHYVEAAERATEVYANEVALANYREALDLLRGGLDRPEDDERVVDVLREIAEVNYLLGEYDEADRYYEYVTDRIDDPEDLRRIYRIRADMASSAGDYEKELELATEGLEVAGTDDTLETCLLYGRKGAGHSHNGQVEEAEAAYERCLEVAKRIDDPTGIAAAYLDFGALDMRKDEVDEGTIETLEDAVDAAERSDDDRTLARALNNLAMALMDLGRLDEAEEVYHRCLAVQEAMGDRMALCTSLRNLASIYQESSNYDQALETLDRALEVGGQVRNHHLLAWATLQISGIHHQHGDLDLALEYMEDSLEYVRRVGDPDRFALTVAYTIDLLLDRGDDERAGELVGELRSSLEEVETPYYVSMGRAILGDYHHVRDDLDRAVEEYEAGLAVEIEEMPPHPLLYNANGLVEVAVDRDDAEAAREHVGTVGEIAGAIGGDWTTASAAVHEGLVLSLEGDHDAAVDRAEEALAIYRSEDSVSKVGEVHALLGLARIHRDAGDGERARERAEAAAEVAENCGIGRYVEEIEAVLEDVESDPGSQKA